MSRWFAPKNRLLPGFKETQKVARRAHYSHGHAIAVYKHRHQDEKGRWLGGINHGWHLKWVKTRNVPWGFDEEATNE